MFFEQLNKICKDKNIKITPLILKLGMSKGNIEKWRNGMIPNGDSLIKIANELDVSVDYLLGRTEKPDVNR